MNRSKIVLFVVILAAASMGAGTSDAGKKSASLSLASSLNLGYAVRYVSALPDGKIIAVGTRIEDMQGIASIIAPDADGRFAEIQSTPLSRGFVQTAMLSPDGKQLAAGYGETRTSSGLTASHLDLHEVRGRSLSGLYTIPGAHADAISWVTYSPDGRYLASASHERIDRTVKIWDLADSLSPRLARTIPMGFFDSEGNLGKFRLSRNAVLLGERRFIDALTGKLIKRFNDKEQPVSGESIALAPKQNILVIAGRAYEGPDNALLSAFDVSDPQKPKRLQVIRRHLREDCFTAVAISRDAYLIAAGTDSGKLLLYALSSNTPLWTGDATPPGKAVKSISFTHDAKFLVTANSGGTFTIWHLLSPQNK